MIDVKVERGSGNALEFPKLMKSKSGKCIGWFISDGVGFCLSGTVFFHIKGTNLIIDAGDFSKEWEMSYFDDFVGSITIRNMEEM